MRYCDERFSFSGVAAGKVAVETRLIAATAQDIHRVIGDGKFRDDLCFSFVTICVPALRERGNDILLLANAFARTFASRYRKRLTDFSADAKDAMMSFDWPGNVRELRHRVLRGVILAEGTSVTRKDLDLDGRTPTGPDMNLQKAWEVFEGKMVTKALVQCEGNLTKVAKQLGISRPTLYDMMDKLGLQRPS